MKTNHLGANPMGLATTAAVIMASVGIIHHTSGAKPPPPPPAPTYHFVPLGTFGGLSASATAVNQHGLVAGMASLDMNNQRQHAFVVVPEDTNGDGRADRWFRDDNGDSFNDLILDLGVGAGFEGLSSYAADVNDARQVVVNCESQGAIYVPPQALVLTPSDVDGDGQLEWFWPDANGANALMVRLEFGPALAGADAQGKAINRAGQVVGGYNNGRGFLINALDSDGDGVADTWFQDLNGDGINDLLVDLGEAVGLQDSLAPVRPARINDAGIVVGAVAMNAGTSAPGVPFIIAPTTDAGGRQVWYLDANHDGINDLVIKLPVLATGKQGEALGLNAAGAVVGWAKTSADVPHAMLWRIDAQGGVTTTDLGLLKNEAECLATAVNHSLQVVGFGRTYNMKQRSITLSSLLWQNGVMSALRSLVDQPALLTGLRNVANDINNDGMIVGYGTTSTSYYPFIAIPIR